MVSYVLENVVRKLNYLIVYLDLDCRIVVVVVKGVLEPSENCFDVLNVVDAAGDLRLRVQIGNAAAGADQALWRTGIHERFSEI